MKSWQAHYLNKYPGGHVEASDHSFKAYDANGKLRVSMSFGGDGQWHDQSEEMGLSDRHDLSPIPKDSRVHKVRDGKIAFDELADERKALLEDFTCDENLRVKSCEELEGEKQGFKFDEKQVVSRRPEKAEKVQSKKKK